jgi:hypothetical protein
MKWQKASGKSDGNASNTAGEAKNPACRLPIKIIQKFIRRGVDKLSRIPIIPLCLTHKAIDIPATKSALTSRFSFQIIVRESGCFIR